MMLAVLQAMGVRCYAFVAIPLAIICYFIVSTPIAGRAHDVAGDAERGPVQDRSSMR